VIIDSGKIAIHHKYQKEMLGKMTMWMGLDETQNGVALSQEADPPYSQLPLKEFHAPRHVASKFAMTPPHDSHRVYMA
jgi:hypothetical protein